MYTYDIMEFEEGIAVDYLNVFIFQNDDFKTS